MFERINGKLYKLVDESEVAKYEPIIEKIKTFQNGIETCDKSIAAFNDQKQKYVAEINKIILDANIDKEELKQLFPEKIGGMGF